MTSEGFKALRKRLRASLETGEIHLAPFELRILLDAADERDKLQQDDAYIALKLNNDDLRASAEQFKAQRDRLAATLRDVEYGLTKGRIWGGMEWTYNPLHPVHYKPLIEKIRAALAESALERMSIDSGAVLNKAFDFIRDLRYGYTLLGSAKGWDMTKDATIQKVDAFFAEHKRPVE